jgi:hypothetical protein
LLAVIHALDEVAGFVVCQEERGAASVGRLRDLLERRAGQLVDAVRPGRRTLELEKQRQLSKLPLELLLRIEELLVLLNQRQNESRVVDRDGRLRAEGSEDGLVVVGEACPCALVQNLQDADGTANPT